MSDDLPARLRAAADGGTDAPWWWDAPDRGGPAQLLREAADEIDRPGTDTEIDAVNAWTDDDHVVISLREANGHRTGPCRKYWLALADADQLEGQLALIVDRLRDQRSRP